MKLAWDVPLDTYTYIVENCLADKFVPLRKQIYSRYVNFFHNLLTSSSKEVRHLARNISRDAKCTVFKNIQLIEQISGPNPWDYASWRILENIENVAAPPNNNWRMKMLLKLLETRGQKSAQLEETKRLTLMINSLCNT